MTLEERIELINDADENADEIRNALKELGHAFSIRREYVDGEQWTVRVDDEIQGIFTDIKEYAAYLNGYSQAVDLMTAMAGGGNENPRYGMALD